MSLRVAITRASPGAERTAARVRAYGAEPILAQLLHIAPRAFDTDVTGVQALVFTSPNGVRAFANASVFRAGSVFVVGAATEAAAKRAGFQPTVGLGGNVEALTTLLIHSLTPERGKVIHISGAHVAGDLVGALRRVGFDADRRVAYGANVATSAPPAFAGALDVVLFHSARAAKAFVDLGAPGAARLTAGCLSPAVATVAARATWARLVVASSPHEESLLDATLKG